MYIPCLGGRSRRSTVILWVTISQAVQDLHIWFLSYLNSCLLLTLPEWILALLRIERKPSVTTVYKVAFPFRYVFRGFTVYERVRDHFSLVFYWHGRMFHYDAMRRVQILPIEKISVEKLKPNHGVYFLDGSCKK